MTISGKWRALHQGALRIDRGGCYRGACRCSTGTCEGCLRRLGLVSDRSVKAAKKAARLARQLDEQLDLAATARAEDRPHDEDVHAAAAIVAHDELEALGVRR